MKISGKRVLVTGAAGFIGSHLVERLVRDGCRVRAFVRNNSRSDRGNLELLDPRVASHAEIAFGDVRDLDSVEQAVRGCDTVFHLAALISVPYSFVNPSEFVQTNVQGTSNVLLAARRFDVRRIVHTSTSEVYGTAQYTPIDEGHPLCAQSPYAASKIGADKVAESFWRTYGLPVVTLRPFNNFGPRQSARAILPTIVSQALRGPTVRVGSRSPRRDFLFVEDTVEAFVRAATAAAAVGETLNLGTGKAHSVDDALRTVGRLLNVRLQVVEEQRRVRPSKSEVHLLLADASRARRLLKWTPKVSFEEGLRRAIEWTRTHLPRFKPTEYNL